MKDKDYKSVGGGPKMSKVKLFSKLIPIVLIVSIFLTACDVPDISKFTEQSAEMTRGIRKGVKDNESLIKSASEREDLYSVETRAKLKENLKNYQSAIKPTVAALDALDAYLEALNALSQANKKSGENASAAVTSISNLVTAVTGFTTAGSTINIATGLVTLAEQFRTARDFKKRVTLAAEIVEGVHPVIGENGKPKKDIDGRVIYLRTCNEDASGPITEASKTIKAITRPILEHLTKDEAKQLKDASPDKKWEVLNNLGKFKGNEFAQIRIATNTIDAYGCGVIDFIKFNIKDLKEINRDVSQSMLDNIREKDTTVFGLHDNLVKSRRDIQDKLENIQVAKNLIPIINEYIALSADLEAIISRKVRFKRTLDNLFLLDPPLKATILDGISKCGETNCGKMLDVLSKDVTLASCDAACVDALKQSFRDMKKPQFDRSTAIIIPILDTRRSELSDEDEKYRSDLERLEPDFNAVTAELDSVRTKRDQLDALLNSSMSALDAWAEAHANLRVAVNTNKPLSVSKLTSKVREIWGIINAATT
jgi:predicted nuclease with TOPRIM domain